MQSLEIDFTRLLGFQTIAETLTEDLNLQDETLGAKLGAKVGDLESVTSDARLKRDINHLATRSDGLQIYSFRYLWDDEVHVGVMAQDLLRNEAWAPAVVTKEGGNLFVDYARLGLRMTTLDEWQAKGMAALTR